jgi:hypothetical protein
MRLVPMAASLALACVCAAVPALGADKARANDSPYVGRSYAENVYFGDTHLHTSWSPDAGGAGNTRIDPDDADRFARGEVVTGHNGEPVRLRRPLDFLVVSDPSEYLGLYPMLEEGCPNCSQPRRAGAGAGGCKRASAARSARSSRRACRAGRTGSAAPRSRARSGAA